MSKIGNPDFNWSAPSLEKEFIRFKRVARNNFIAHKQQIENNRAVSKRLDRRHR